MTTSNIVRLNDNPLHSALLKFGIHNAVAAQFVSGLVKRGDITLASKFFMPLQEYLEYAELTPSGLSKWTTLEHQDNVFRSKGGETDISDPALQGPNGRIIFSVERIQDYVSEGLEHELLSMTHGPYRQSKGLGGNS
jgi:hypothetical protein